MRFLLHSTHSHHVSCENHADTRFVPSYNGIFSISNTNEIVLFPVHDLRAMDEFV